MRSQSRLLIVVADGAHARFVRPAEDHALHSDSEIDPPGAHRCSAAFARSIAQRLNTASAGDGFDELVLVAPADTLREILETLDTAVERKVVGVVRQDLVEIPDDALWPHLQGWVRPVIGGGIGG